MSSSHFCAANSAVQITSEKNTSHSADLASWRWTNWLRCSSAEVGNSSSLAVRPEALFFALKSLTAAVWLPDVSLPRQNVTLPVASLDAATVGAFATPFVTPVAAAVLVVPPPPPPLLLLSSLPHATTNIASATTNAAANLFRATIERTLLLKPFVPRGSPPNERDPTGKSQAEYPCRSRANQAGPASRRPRTPARRWTVRRCRARPRRSGPRRPR